MDGRLRFWRIGLRIAAWIIAFTLMVEGAVIVLGRREVDPGQIVFMRRAGYDASIYVLDTAHMTERTLFTVPPALPADLPKLSRDGQHIAFELWGAGGLAIQALDTQKQVLYTTDPSLQDRLPSWSPDGTRLAFWSNRLTPEIRNQRWQNWNFYLYDLTSQQIQPMTELFSILPYNIPLWSPDGQYILLNYWRPVTGAGMFIINVATGELHQVDGAIETGSDLVWSRDSSRIAFRANPDGNSEILLMSIITGDISNLTEHPANDFEPAWSPDGERLTFTSNRTGRGEIYVMNPDGSQLEQITHDGGWHPVWSPDGTQIAFLSNRGGHTAYYVTRLDGSNVRYLANSDQHTLLGWLTHP